MNKRKATLFGLSLVGSMLLLPANSEARDRRVGLDFGIQGRLGSVGLSLRTGRSRSFPGVARGCRDTLRHSYRYRLGVPARSVHHHHWVTHYERVWVPPTYRTVFSGYNACGHPIYRNICVRAGYYRQVRRGHRGCRAARSPRAGSWLARSVEHLDRSAELDHARPLVQVVGTEEDATLGIAVGVANLHRAVGRECSQRLHPPILSCFASSSSSS